MSVLPLRMVNRWERRQDLQANQAQLYWHILMENQPEARALAIESQRSIRKFPGLHFTPARRLHITLLSSGLLDEMTTDAIHDMLREVRLSLSGVPPIAINIGKVLYHPEAIALGIQPAHALDSVYNAVLGCARGSYGAAGKANGEWVPHMTIAYSTASQSAEPIIATLGLQVPTCHATINGISLVTQHGAERDWNWRVLAEIPLDG